MLQVLTHCAALLVHGGGHIMLSRKDVPTRQVAWLLDHGIIPVSVDYRLCPEVSIRDGPMTDVADAFVWARRCLPCLKLRHSNMQFDGDRVGIVGWSSGGMLALSIGWTAQSRNVKPPEAVATFYCPIDYEDQRKPSLPSNSLQFAAGFAPPINDRRLENPPSRTMLW
jgi:acetyl esterase/lipase